MTDRAAIVIIGRNEGARLEACLASIPPGLSPVVYVDSGSTDDSVAAAQAAGALVVELDLSRPFTAARARNAGAAALAKAGHAPDYLQFVDGDCTFAQGWVEAGAAFLDANPAAALVTGWLSERDTAASIYNEMCDHEWRGPIGEITACGGNMMVRTSAFRLVDGFNPEVIAAEDDDLCIRLRKAGWRLVRLPMSMATHDANMLHFGQWWRRSVRAGHAFAQVGHLHPDHFVGERRRMWTYGALLPVTGLFCAVVYWPASIAVLAIYLASYMRTIHGLTRSGVPISRARYHAFYLVLSKAPNVTGAIRYRMRKLRGKRMAIIEHKIVQNG